MLAPAFEVLVLVGTGTVAGVLFAVALSTLPALIAMPPGRYIYAHKLLGRNWDPTMPILVLASMVLNVVLAILAAGLPGRVLFAAAAMLLVGVSVVSHWCNVPINKQQREIDPEQVPVDWHDPRTLWRRWHLLRTAFAMLALILTASAVAAG